MLGSKKFKVLKKFWSQRIWGFKKVLVMKKFDLRKNLGPRNLHLPDPFQTPSRHLPDIFQTPSDTFQTPSRHISDTFQRPSRHFPDSFQTHSRHPPDPSGFEILLLKISNPDTSAFLFINRIFQIWTCPDFNILITKSQIRTCPDFDSGHVRISVLQ